MFERSLIVISYTIKPPISPFCILAENLQSLRGHMNRCYYYSWQIIYRNSIWRIFTNHKMCSCKVGNNFPLYLLSMQSFRTLRAGITARTLSNIRWLDFRNIVLALYRNIFWAWQKLQHYSFTIIEMICSIDWSRVKITTEVMHFRIFLFANNNQ